MDMENATVVHRSWINHPFRFLSADSENDNGKLRKPQLAAIYTTLGHISTTPGTPATVVMPTGTGKTDTIFSLIIAGAFERTLIIVPSDSLREQTANKVAQLSTLRRIKAITDETKSPYVKKISSRLDLEEIKQLTDANVLIATPKALHLFDDNQLQSLANICSHLVIDEAHHVAARTWNRIKNAFKTKSILQFTATPFREDGGSLDGKIIYNYSLRDAQKDGYFQDIEFHPVREYRPNHADITIAEKAIALLRQDLDDGKDHLLMVRAKSQSKAEKLFEIYGKQVDLKPVLIHSKVKARAQILADIVAKKHKIIVCVDMLGEGFDLPELKIAAIHDQHRTPAVTLQFIGRMTRAHKDLGTAKFVANIANQGMNEQMSALYEESADWSAIIRDMSQDKIKREMQREELESQFRNDDAGKKILALNPMPKISAIAYQVEPKDWLPQNLSQFKAPNEISHHWSQNEEGTLLLLVTNAVRQVTWAKTEEIENSEWLLYLAYYRERDKTLFIHCSGDEGQATRFRHLISKDAKVIMGERAFRTLHNVDLLRLQNVGLSRMTKDVRFTMHVGRNINSVMNELENGTSIKSNIFATGFEDGRKITAGCSHKGKIWEMNSDSLNHWVSWCDKASSKLNNSAIDTASILNNVLRPEQIVDRWPSGLFYVDWPEDILIETEDNIRLTINNRQYNVSEVLLGVPEIVDPKLLRIPLYVYVDEHAKECISEISIRLDGDGYETACGGTTISLNNGRLLSEYLDLNPLRILKVDGSIIFGNYRYYSPATLDIKLPAHLLEAWDWGDTKIYHESMGRDADLDTVQGFTFKMISQKYQIIFNDDGAGEIADLIGINKSKHKIEVHFYHCKYCSVKNSPGARVEDTYEVTGQASRSVRWLHAGEKLFGQMMKRFQMSIDQGFDRVLKGDITMIDLLRRKSIDKEVELKFHIVQPAISLKKISANQLSVLGTSYGYLKSISGSDLKVIVNK